MMVAAVSPAEAKQESWCLILEFPELGSTYAVNLAAKEKA